ncbi:MAG TPA: EAL domain-containing protein [Methylophilaceae bacterium]|nr:EAL domain-containing protein [Methylophilaceae bacterium]
MKSLHALIVEDSEDDTLLLLNELKKGGYDPIYIRVETAHDMLAELTNKTWDIVYSDFTMPKFSAFDALALLHSTGQDVPFIIVSGTIGEDRAVNAMKAGAHDYILKGNLKRLIPATERELREALVRQEHRIADETIHQLAYIDPVTQLPNRARFHELIDEAIANIGNQKNSIALLLMDLDRFKDVNDTLGHDRGDILLKQVGVRLKSVLFEPDVVARIGGDEFGILLPHLTFPDDIKIVIKKLFDVLSSPFIIDGVPISVEASIGVAALPEHADNPHNLLQRADIAMYYAKKLASNFAIYEPKFNRHSPEQLGLMAELREAIDQGQLVLHYQPKLDIKSGRIIGLEALVRWNHPRLGLLYPDRFIFAAEHTGLIAPLTGWVLKEAMTFIRKLSQNGCQLRVSVNLSARSLHDARLLEMIENVLKMTESSPKQLMLEVTESAIVLDPLSAEATLIELSRLGLSLSIDDFGTGYTSLASIKRLPIDEIKIDKSFITNMLSDYKEAMIVRSVIELGHNLGLTVVAEGIESRNVMETLTTLGCDEIQGYYVCKPKASEDLLAWFSCSSWEIGIKSN